MPDPTTPRRQTIDIDLLRVFDALLRVGSFTLAARSLSRSQSAVSMQLRRLEDQLGVQLVVRRGRRLAPSAEGLQLLPLARQMLGLNAQFFADVDPRSVTGTVRIGSIEHYATRRLPTLVADFCVQHPDIHVEIQHGVSSHQMRELGSRYDIVIGIGPVGGGEGVPLSRSRIVWTSSPKAALHRQRPLPLAVNPEGGMLRSWMLHALDRVRIPWRVAYTSSSVSGLEAAVRAGIAVGVFREETISKRLSILGPKHGLPALPDAESFLASASLSRSAASGLLEAFLLQRLRKVG